MTSCTIIISHYESENFLRACVRQVRKYANEKVRQKIIISDQSTDATYEQVIKEYGNDEDVRIITSNPLYSGYGIDWIMRYINIDTEYICQIHVDAFPISDKWLLLPITLIEEYNLSFVGQLQCINTASNLSPIYPPSAFFAMAQCFNIAKTETYKELSLKAGFTRFHNRTLSGLAFENDDWSEWAKEDYNARGSDDDVVAFHWNGKYKTDDMLGLAITGYIESGYGRIVEDIIFHFGSCREAQGVMDRMPPLYQYYTKRINENYSGELIGSMVNLAKANKPPELDILNRNYWDGKLKQSFPPSEEINKRIEELKI